MKCIRKPVNRKGNGDVIIMSGLHINQCMINPIKSYADWMRNDEVLVFTTQNMFLNHNQ